MDVVVDSGLRLFCKEADGEGGASDGGSEAVSLMVSSFFSSPFIESFSEVVAFSSFVGSFDDV